MIATILALAWPTMLEELLQTAVQYIDTAMVGSLGTAATAAVGATTTVNWLIGSTISALGVGFLSYIAKSCGAGNRQAVKAAMNQLVLVVCAVGVGRPGNSGSGGEVFLRAVFAHAAPDGDHSLWHGTSGCRRYQDADEGGPAGQLHQCNS